MHSKNKLLVILCCIPVLSIAFSFACVPLYSLFCKVTGYGGTIKKVESFEQKKLGKRYIKVRLNADTAPNLNWKFKPHNKEVIARTGDNSLVFYTVENMTDYESEGIAVYNVTPHKAGKYFNKIACFCFERQVLKPKEKVIMPVSFLIDSAIENDREMDDISTLTLSYTFFRYKDYKIKNNQIQ